MNDLEWEDAPASAQPGDLLPIHRAKGARGFFFISLSKRVAGLYTHWIDGHRIPCEGKACFCKKKYAPRRWYGYLSAALLVQRSGAWALEEIGLAELTQDAGGILRKCVPATADLTGRSFHLRRKDNRPQSGCIISQFATPAGLELPAGPDVQTAVRRLYGIFPGSP